MNFTILYQAEPEGGYTVSIPELPGCISFGDTVESATEMIKEAAELYIEEIKSRGEKFSSKRSFIGNLNLSYA